MNRLHGMILLGALLITATLPVQTFAQSATAIKYGDVAKGELTTSKTSITYTFKANANDVVILKMKGDGTDSNVAPLLTVTDSKKQAVADSTKQFSLYSITLVFQITAAGSFTIVASTTDTVKSLGKFQLALSKATILQSGTSVNGHATSEQPAYFAYSSGDPFTISYAKQAGDFAPAVNVSQVADDFSLSEPIGTIGGSLATAGTVSITPATNQLFIVSVEQSTFDFNSKVTADFTLQVDVAK